MKEASWSAASIAHARPRIIQAFIAGAFVSAALWGDSAIIAIGEATFGGMTSPGPILTAGEVDVELIVVDQRGAAWQTVLLLIFIFGREAPMLVTLVVAITRAVLAVSIQVVAG